MEEVRTRRVPVGMKLVVNRVGQSNPDVYPQLAAITQEELDGGDLVPAIYPSAGTKLVLRVPNPSWIGKFFDWYFQDGEIGKRLLVMIGVVALIVCIAWAIVKFAPLPEIWSVVR